MSLPDFLLIGAMKCGTSTLQKQLVLQEGVFMTTPKEPNFFSDDDVYGRGHGWYSQLYAAAAPGDLKGEASTHYTKLPTYPDALARMRSVLPNPRLVYMIRNPLERAISHYIHEWTQGIAPKDPRRAFRELPEMVEYGCYGYQIAPFIETYGAENILLTSLELIRANPDEEFRRIATFLGLKGDPKWIHDLPAQNVSAERIRRFPMQRLLLEHPVTRTLRRTLVPVAVRDWVKRQRTMQARPEIPVDLEQDMIQRFMEDRKVLAGFFPDHAALDACYPFAATPAVH